MIFNFQPTMFAVLIQPSDGVDLDSASIETIGNIR
jgi:hypothetical protein